MKPVIFLIQDKNCGASFMLGQLVKHGLDHFEINSQVKYLEDINTIKDSVVIVFKHSPTIQNIEILKSNNNKIIMDVVDEFIRPGTDVTDLYDYSQFDGVLVRVKKILDEYSFPNHLILGYIPHHWDIRLQDVQPRTEEFNPIPLCTINDGRDMPYIQELHQKGKVSFAINFSYSKFGTLIDEFSKYNIHYNVRETDSLAYKFKPHTKLVTASAFHVPLITNYDWATQDLIPSDYPFLVNGNSYQELEDMVTNYPKPGSKEWEYAMDIMNHVRVKTALINLVPEYIELYKQF